MNKVLTLYNSQIFLKNIFNLKIKNRILNKKQKMFALINRTVIYPLSITCTKSNHLVFWKEKKLCQTHIIIYSFLTELYGLPFDWYLLRLKNSM